MSVEPVETSEWVGSTSLILTAQPALALTLNSGKTIRWGEERPGRQARIGSAPASLPGITLEKLYFTLDTMR